MGKPVESEPVAIVGIGCRFPGKANTPSKLWDLLCQPHEVAKEIPVNRFNLNKFYHSDGSHHGTCNVKKTYFLDEDIRHFDAGFFGIPPGGKIQLFLAAFISFLLLWKRK
jgi:acyl transferase domain-containing protein